MNLSEQFDNIKTREDFIAFLLELQKDFKNNKDDWENCTIDTYLEATAACLKDNEWNPETLDWKFLARIFLGGKSYE